MSDLGKGSFGKVKKVIDKQTNKAFALKILNKARLKKKKIGKSVSAFSLIEKEIAVMKKLAHPNICKLFEVIDDPAANKLYLIME